MSRRVSSGSDKVSSESNGAAVASDGGEQPAETTSARATAAGSAYKLCRGASVRIPRQCSGVVAKMPRSRRSSMREAAARQREHELGSGELDGGLRAIIDDREGDIKGNRMAQNRAVMTATGTTGAGAGSSDTESNAAANSLRERGGH